MQTLDKYNREQLGDVQDSLYLVSTFIKDNSKVLDVGCYQGSLGRYLIENKNCIVDGIEYESEAANIARTFYRKVVTADLNNEDVTSLLASDYEYIVFADVLEHLLDPNAVLSKLKSLLMDSGKVVISVPNIGYQGVLAGLSDGEFKYRETGILDKTHLRFFTRKSLKELIKSCDLFTNEIKSVILPSEHSEFREHFCTTKSLKPNMFLNLFPDSSAYQFVALCGLTDVLESMPEENFSPKINQRFRSKLYWKDVGEEYSDDRSIDHYSDYTDKGTCIVFELDSSNSFTQLRFDPCEESMFCYINSIVIKSQSDETLFTQVMSDIEPSNEETNKFTFADGEVAISSEGSDPGVLVDFINKDKPAIDSTLKVVIELGRINSYCDIDRLMNDIYQSYREVVNNRDELLAPQSKLLSSKLYWKENGDEYSDTQSIVQGAEYSNEEQILIFELDGVSRFDQLRFDPCEEPVFCQINSITVTSQNDEALYTLPMSDIETSNEKTKKITLEDGSIVAFSVGGDLGISIGFENKDKAIAGPNLKIVIHIGKMCSYSGIGELMSCICQSNEQQLETAQELDTSDSLNFVSKLYWKELRDEYSDTQSLIQFPKYSENEHTLTYELDEWQSFDQLRFDPCEEPMFCYIKSIVITSEEGNVLFNQSMNDVKASNHETKKIVLGNDAVAIYSDGSDPSIIIDISNKDNVLNDKKIKVVISMGKIHPYTEINNLIEDIYQNYSKLLISRSWKLTKPLRKAISIFSTAKHKVAFTSKKIRNIKLRQVIKILLTSLKNDGIVATKDKISSFIINKDISKESEDCALGNYQKYLAQEDEHFAREKEDIISFLGNKVKPKLSILLPVYNTDEFFLKECIESLITQSYSNWELCICDDASTSPHVVNIIDGFSQKDTRIKYIVSERNGHISHATNQALKLATGSHVVLLDHDDMLHTDALLYIANEIVKNPSVDFIYTDEDHVSENGERKMPFFKPDWSPTLLYSQNYIGHIVCLSKGIIDQVDGFTIGLEGAQDYDLILKSSLHFKSVVHIPRVLYHWREHEQSTAMNADSKPYAHDAGKKALSNHLSTKYPAIFSSIEDGDNLFTYKPQFKISKKTKASIIIPIRDKVELLQQLITSIEEKSTWNNYEVIIIDNGSVQEPTLEYLNQLQLDDRFQVVKDNSKFNWSKVNNLGVTAATGDVFIFLNNDTIVISENWLESLLSWALVPDVAVVGPQLRYEDNTIQHAGVVLGMGGWADHIFKCEEAEHRVGPFVSPILNRNVLAVTGACQAIERNKFEMLGGFDEEFEICGSDVELCVRAHKSGYQNMYLADVTLYHLESKSRSNFVPENDFNLSRIKYEPYRTKLVDPYFNPNLDMMSSTPTVKL